MEIYIQNYMRSLCLYYWIKQANVDNIS